MDDCRPDGIDHRHEACTDERGAADRIVERFQTCERQRQERGVTGSRGRRQAAQAQVTVRWLGFFFCFLAQLSTRAAHPSARTWLAGGGGGKSSSKKAMTGQPASSIVPLHFRSTRACVHWVRLMDRKARRRSRKHRWPGRSQAQGQDQGEGPSQGEDRRHDELAQGQDQAQECGLQQRQSRATLRSASVLLAFPFDFMLACAHVSIAVLNS